VIIVSSKSTHGFLAQVHSHRRPQAIRSHSSRPSSPWLHVAGIEKFDHEEDNRVLEPALDYLVLKMPRWDLAKFDKAADKIGSEMKSVGEVMAIGRSFEEVLQKAMRMLNIGANGFTAQTNGNFTNKDYLAHIKDANHHTYFRARASAEDDVKVEKIHSLSGIDPWFLEKMRNIVETERSLQNVQKLTWR